MSERKTRREIDKAIRHLIDYTGPNGEWESRLDELTDQFLAPVADNLDLSDDEVLQFFTGGDFAHMVFGFLFETCATMRWDGDDQTLVSTYMKHRGWREGLAGRRYLQALGKSKLQFWEITNVDPGAYVDVRPYGTKEKSIRVKEKAASENLRKWDGLAARVLPMGGGHRFSGAMLPLRPDIAQKVQNILQGLPDNAQETLQALVDKSELEALPEDLDSLCAEMAETGLPQVVFRIWAIDVYMQYNRAAPELRNMDDESIEMTQLRFPLKAKPAVVAAALNKSAVLEKDPDADRWTWIPDLNADPAVERINIHGFIELTDSALTLDTDSVARAQRGGKMLTSLLGKSVGKALTVHENMDRMAENAAPVEMPSDVPAEIAEAVQAHLTGHYRQTLDDPIPMLHGKTPRECAADPALRSDVIGWLKSLENSSDRGPQSTYDFGWMWTELNLERD